MNEERNKIEALLFASGNKLLTDEITRLCELDNNQTTKRLLVELKKDLKDKGSPLMLVDENNHWKLTVRERFLPLVRKIVADTELSKSVTETLAVIAWRSPIKQSIVIEIRSNKAYEHIKELVDLGFITKGKSGRSYIIKLTDKFFEYFEVHGKDDIMKMFKGVKERAQESVKKKEEMKLNKGLEIYDTTLQKDDNDPPIKVVDITQKKIIQDSEVIEKSTTSIREEERMINLTEEGKKEIEEIKKEIEEEEKIRKKKLKEKETEKEDDGKRKLNLELEKVLKDK